MDSGGQRIDPITLEVIRGAFTTLADEIDTNLARTAYSMLIYEYKDYAVGILDVEEDFGPAFNVREIRLYPGDPFAREPRVEPASRIESSDFYGSQFVEPACTVRGPIDGGVVQDVALAVFAGPYVDLHVVDAPGQATVGGGEGVLGGDFVRTPVADDFDSRAGNGWGSRGLRCVS